jgi:hypothetical protein
MTEYFRKDPRLIANQARIADPHSTDPLTTDQSAERTARTETESDTLVTPPPAEPRSSSVTSGHGSSTGTAAARAPEEERAALFASNESSELRARWDSIQVGFVDEPRRAVEEADALVSQTMKRLAEIFSDERQKLEQQWGRSENISTEDFRVALRRYRSFFARLLAI